MADLEFRNAQQLVSKHHPAERTPQDDSSQPHGGKMDIFSHVIGEFCALPAMDTWDEARLLFEQAAVRKPEHWLIPA